MPQSAIYWRSLACAQRRMKNICISSFAFRYHLLIGQTLTSPLNFSVARQIKTFEKMLTLRVHEFKWDQQPSKLNLSWILKSAGSGGIFILNFIQAGGYYVEHETEQRPFLSTSIVGKKRKKNSTHKQFSFYIKYNININITHIHTHLPCCWRYSKFSTRLLPKTLLRSKNLLWLKEHTWLRFHDWFPWLDIRLRSSSHLVFTRLVDGLSKNLITFMITVI